MNDKEKILFLKDTIYQLYSIEGKNKTYIAKLLRIGKSDLNEAINKWSLNPAQKKYFTPSETKFYKKNRQKIDKLIKRGMSKEDIAKFFNVDFYLINNYEEYKKNQIKKTKYKNENNIKEIIYKNKFRFKTVEALGRFLKIPTQKTKELLANPKNNQIKIIYKNNCND